MEKKLLRMESMMSRSDAAEKLHSLADKLEEGSVELSAGEDSVSLQPSESVEFELEVEEESDGDLSIEIDIEWNDEEEGQDLEIG